MTWLRRILASLWRDLKPAILEAAPITHPCGCCGNPVEQPGEERHRVGRTWYSGGRVCAAYCDGSEEEIPDVGHQ